MKTTISNDLSLLTTINESTFTKLSSKIEWCINDCVAKAAANNEDQAEIDLGFGTLIISISNSEIKYKFKPSQKLERSVANAVMTERNDLNLNIENALVSKLTNVYKSFF